MEPVTQWPSEGHVRRAAGLRHHIRGTSRSICAIIVVDNQLRNIEHVTPGKGNT